MFPTESKTFLCKHSKKEINVSGFLALGYWNHTYFQQLEVVLFSVLYTKPWWRCFRKRPRLPLRIRKSRLCALTSYARGRVLSEDRRDSTMGGSWLSFSKNNTFLFIYLTWSSCCEHIYSISKVETLASPTNSRKKVCKRHACFHVMLSCELLCVDQDKILPLPAYLTETIEIKSHYITIRFFLCSLLWFFWLILNLIC